MFSRFETLPNIPALPSETFGKTRRGTRWDATKMTEEWRPTEDFDLSPHFGKASIKAEFPGSEEGFAM